MANFYRVLNHEILPERQRSRNDSEILIFIFIILFRCLLSSFFFFKGGCYTLLKISFSYKFSPNIDNIFLPLFPIHCSKYGVDDGVLLWNLLTSIYVIYSGFTKTVTKAFEKNHECMCLYRCKQCKPILHLRLIDT